MAPPNIYASIGIFQLFLVFQAVLSRPNGAPHSTCTDLTPAHGAPLSGISPFRFHIQTLSNRRLSVRLLSSDSQPFQGFILQAREVGSDVPLGRFTTVPADTKAVRCTNDDDTATHSNAAAKFDLVFFWSPPQNYEGDIVFLATISEDYARYWLRISSKQVTLSLKSQKERSTDPVFTTSKPSSASESPTYIVPDTELLTQPSQVSATDPPLATESPTYMTYTELLTGPFQLAATDPPLATESPTYMTYTELLTGPAQPPDTDQLAATESPTYMTYTELLTGPFQLAATDPPLATESPTYMTYTELLTGPSQPPEIDQPTAAEPSTYSVQHTEIRREPLPERDQPASTESPTYMAYTEQLTTPSPLTTTDQPAATESPTYMAYTEQLTTPSPLTTTDQPAATESPTYIVQHTEILTEPSSLPEIGQPTATESPTYMIPDTELLTEPSSLPETSQPTATESPTQFVPDTDIVTETEPYTLPETEPPSVIPTTPQSPITTQEPAVTKMSPQKENRTKTMQPSSGTRAQGTTQEQSRMLEQSTTQPPPMIFRGKTYSVELSINGQFDPELNNNQSQKFKDLAATLKTQIENVYREANKSVDVKVLRFSPDNFIVELTLAFDMEMSEPLNPLQESVKDGRLRNIAIIPYSIKLIGKNTCALNMCHRNATCIQTSDSFMCKCSSGFTGDGIFSCAVITPVAAKQETSKDDDLMKKLLIASLVIVGVILLVVIFSLIILLHRIFQNGKSEVNR